MIRVAVVGSECSGKTTLAAALAAHYQTAWVPEFARQFVIDKGAAPDYEDVEAIARGQIVLEDEKADEASRLLIEDTDLFSTVLYSRHYYGDCPRWIEAALEKRAADHLPPSRHRHPLGPRLGISAIAATGVTELTRALPWRSRRGAA